LKEAGVKVDLVAGRGMGAVGALLAAVDADARLWEPSGIWMDRRGPGQLYPWRLVWRIAACALLAALTALSLPIAAWLLLALAYAPVFLLELVLPSAGDLTGRLGAWALAVVRGDGGLPLILRASAAAIVVLMLLLLATYVRERARARRRGRGGAFHLGLAWTALGAPLSSDPAFRWALEGFWSFVHGATPVPRPDHVELSRRYAELLSENIDQPGYRELVVTAHDLDTHRDVVFAWLAPTTRQRFFANFGRPGEDERAGEVVDLAGSGRDHVVDGIAACLSVPLLTAPYLVAFGSHSFWRGETHRLCDRPGGVVRLLEELSAAGVEQVILVSAAPAIDRPHALGAVPLDPRARLGEYLAATEVAAARDALTALFDRFSGIFQIQPAHNPVGPFDFTGAYDPRSDRWQALDELVDRGYEDAYRQFIEPVVGASGDELEQRQVPRKLPDPTPSISEMLARLE
jgi:hypothetical protein